MLPLKRVVQKKKKICVFIAAILSELHAPWQPVMQGYRMPTPRISWHHSDESRRTGILLGEHGFLRVVRPIKIEAEALVCVCLTHK